MKTVEEIVDLATRAKMAAGPMQTRRREVRDLWGGDIAIPLTEMYDDERGATANMARLGIDGAAQRIASTAPDVRWFPKKAGFKQWEEQARKKRQVSTGWHEKNAMEIIRYRRARHIWAYAETPVQVRWNRKDMIPEWFVRDPLATFTADPKRSDDMLPDWAIFAYVLPLGFIRKRWPDAWMALNVGDRKTDDVQVECIEFIDEDQITLVAVGQKAPTWDMWASAVAASVGTVLESVPNPAHMPTVVVPGLVGITDERRSRVEMMVGKYIKAARLDALQSIAIEEGIFPKQWLVARQGEVPKIIQVADPRKGQLGIVQGGVLDVQQLQPGYRTPEALADLERAARADGGVPAGYSGEATSGARTARMSDTVEGAATDFAYAEVQKILARSEQHELEIAAETAKSYGGDVSVSMYVYGKGNQGEVTYKANDLFESCAVSVRYSMAGTDLNQQVVRIGQKMQLGLISEQTARERDPEVEDAELEKDRITAEGIEKALLAQIQAVAAQPDGPLTPDQLARIAELVITNKMELFEAVSAVHKEAQQIQASAPPEAGEGEMASPDMMPGLAAPSAPGAGAPIPPDLTSLAGRLKAAMGQGDFTGRAA